MNPGWLSDDCLMTAQWLSYDYLIELLQTVNDCSIFPTWHLPYDFLLDDNWQLLDDFLMTALLLSDDCHIYSWHPEDYFRIELQNWIFAPKELKCLLNMTRLTELESFLWWTAKWALACLSSPGTYNLYRLEVVFRSQFQSFWLQNTFNLYKL